jgi:hypothetical protein
MNFPQPLDCPLPSPLAGPRGPAPHCTGVAL